MPPCDVRGFVLSTRLQERRVPPLHFIRLHLLDVVADVPAVPERIPDHTGALAVELVLRLPFERRTKGERTGNCGVRVINMQVQRYRGAQPSFGPVMPSSGNSSDNISVVPLKSTSAWPIRPEGSVSRIFSRAPNVFV